MRRTMILLVALLFAVFALQRCNSGARSELTFNGKKIIVNGGSSHSMISEDSGYRIEVDGHTILIDANAVMIDGITKPMPASSEIVFTVDEDGVRMNGAYFGQAEASFETVQASLRQPGRLPPGFVRADGVPGTGQVVYAHVTGRTSSTTLLGNTLSQFSQYFDGPLRVDQAFRETNDRQAQAAFLGHFEGQPIAGVAMASVYENGAVVGLVFDHRGTLPASVNELLATLEKHGVVQQETRPARPINWYRAPFPDGSGSILLPQGWKVTSSYQGAVDIAGPGGEAMALGYGYPVVIPQAAQNPATGAPMEALIASPGDPVNALQTLLPQIGAYLTRRNQQPLRFEAIRVIESAPVPSAVNGRAAYLLWDVRVNGQPYRLFSYVDCSPAPTGWWTFYLSSAAAPPNRFNDQLPVMLEAWQKGWNINPEVFRQRLDNAFRTMKETHRIMNRTIRNQQQTFDNARADWTEVFRGTRTVRDTRLQEDWQTDIGWVDETVQQLNERAGYQRFEQIPLRDFNQ